MTIQVGALSKADEKQAIRFAVTGMHFDWYFDSQFLLNLYARYFWYLEITRATQILAAYVQGEFAGVLLAKMKGQDRQRRSIWRSLYVRMFDGLQRLFSQKGAGAYEEANQEMLAAYQKEHTPDGEILFLAAAPDRQAKGIGSALLAELERREPGKQIYLYTDNACTYSFYERRGFERICEKAIVLDLPKGPVPLTCFLYSKVLPKK